MAENGGWSKWWWLSYLGVQEWTAEERKVRIRLGMSVLFVTVLFYFIVVGVLLLVGVERHFAAILALLISMVPGFGLARPIGAMLYPGQLRNADLNARKRLSKTTN